MSFPDDLLEQAFHLANREPANPKQASLRRAVSTGYYALFHLLIDEAVGNWSIERQRSILARTFNHNKMKSVCDGVCKDFKSGSSETAAELFTVAKTFIHLQQHRHLADYDNSKEWSRADVFTILRLAKQAFTAWGAIRSSDAAQDYLLTLFLPKPPRQ